MIDVRQAPTVLPSATVPHHLVSRVEIAEMFGVTRQRVHQLVSRPDFPEPIAVLGVGMIWNREDVEQWARRTGRLPVEDDE